MKKLATLALATVLLALSATHASAMVSEPCHVPDAASTAALFGAGVIGLLGVRRLLGKR